MINIFILCTEVIIELLVLYNQKIKFNFPHYAIIKHCAMWRTGRWDSKASTVMSYPLENCVYDITVLALLSHRHSAQCSIITWRG